MRNRRTKNLNGIHKKLRTETHKGIDLSSNFSNSPLSIFWSSDHRQSNSKRGPDETNITEESSTSRKQKLHSCLGLHIYIFLFIV